MNRRWRRAAQGALPALATLGLVTSLARPAQADWRDAATVGIITLGGLFIADVTFATYGLVVAGEGELPSKGWTIAETVVASPQALLCNIATAAFSKKEDDGVIALFMIPAGGTSALLAHGIWGTASDTVDPGMLAGGSVVIGVNAPFTSTILSQAVQGRLSPPGMGIAQMIVPLPQTVVTAYEIAHDPENRAGWIALTAWSGAIMLHGGLSLLLHENREEEERAYKQDEASFHFGPTMVPGNFAPAPGFGAFGVF